MTNPNTPVATAVEFDNAGTWTFYNGWNGLALVVQAYIGGSSFKLNDDTLGLIGSAIIGPTPDGWVDVACDLEQMEIHRGATESSLLAPAQPGTCELILDNVAGKYNPGVSLGNVLNLGTTVRVMARNTDIIPFFEANTSEDPNDYMYRWFTGQVDQWDLSGWASGKPTATFTCVDDMALLAQYQGAPTSPFGAGQTTEGRINYILSETGWATRDAGASGGIHTTVAWFGSGDNPTHQDTTQDDTAWSLIEKAAQGASRLVFVNGDGRVTSAPLSPASYDDWTQQAWGCGEGTDLPIVDGTFAQNKDSLINAIDAQREGGALVTIVNQSSVDQYGAHRASVTDLTLEDDNDVTGFAAFVIAAESEPTWRIDSVRVLPLSWPSSEGGAFVVDRDEYVSEVYDSTTQVAAWDVVSSEITWLSGFGRRHVVTLELPHDAGELVDTVAIRGCRIVLDPTVCDIRFVTASVARWVNILTLNDDTLGRLTRGNVLR